MALRARLRAAVLLAGAHFRQYPLQMGLATGGVVLAVLLVTLIVGLGTGVTDAGTNALRWLGQDLWVSAGPLRFAPGAVGGVQNPLFDAHNVTRDIERTRGVRSAGALAFQTVYVSPNRSEFTTVVGVGGMGNSSKFTVQRGPGFERGDVHYANGSYTGPMTHAVIVDERTAALFNVSVGDHLYIGGTLASARQNKFTVVGISNTFSTFLGTPTVTLHLSELQEVTGTTGTDPASMIVVRTEPDADVTAVRNRLTRQYPEYDVRTNREQLRSFVGTQSAVLTGAVVLVALAIVAGAILVVNVLGLFVFYQRVELAALKAAGISTGTLVAMVGGQGILIGVLGAAVGIGLTPFVAAGLNGIIADLTGFRELIITPARVYVLGGGIGLVMGIIGAASAGWRVARLSPLEHLQR